MSSARARNPQRPLAAHLPAFFGGPDGDIEGVASEIAPQGLFICTDTPAPERRLVHVRVPLPDGQGDVELHGVVSRSLNAARAHFLGQPAGMEVQLCGGDPRSRSRWTALIGRLQSERDEQDQQDQQTAGSRAGQRRATPRRRSVPPTTESQRSVSPTQPSRPARPTPQVRQRGSGTPPERTPTPGDAPRAPAEERTAPPSRRDTPTPAAPSARRPLARESPTPTVRSGRPALDSRTGQPVVRLPPTETNRRSPRPLSSAARGRPTPAPVSAGSSQLRERLNARPGRGRRSSPRSTPVPRTTLNPRVLHSPYEPPPKASRPTPAPQEEPTPRAAPVDPPAQDSQDSQDSQD